ncbi:DoxX family protein [Peribacillus kribbensis]|uniref:DoxX family protein n=1 Tax=Peribacillus kribbensis TaxID=356658 RepID=UPI000401826A|nr:DoxX family protein [Peribacillus kribbensis]
MKNKLEVSTLLLRFVLGISFFIHGFVKFHDGIGNIVSWFESMGLPGGLAYVTAAIEMVGGIAIVLGLGTRIVSILLSLLMIGAIIKVKLAVGFLGNGQMAGYELDVAYLVIAVFLAVNGSRLLALDSLFFKGQSVPDENNEAA